MILLAQILAQVPTGSPATQAGPVGSWLLIAIAIMAGLLILMNLASYFATRREVTAMERRIEAAEARITAQAVATKEVTDDLFSKLGGVERGVRTELKGDIEKLRSDIQSASADVAGLSATATQLNQSLAAMQARLDRFIERSTP